MVKWSKPAKLDLKQIYDYIARDSKFYAQKISQEIVEKSEKLKLDREKYLSDDNSYEFFQKTGDGIFTGKLESNVSDLMVVFKNNV